VESVSLMAARSEREWDALAARNGGTFFHRHLFLSTMAEGLGLVLDLRVAQVDGVPVGAVPLLYKRLGPVCTANWLPFPYIGPLVPAGLLAPTLDALVGQERRVRCVRAQHVLLSVRDEPFAGYESSPDRTFVIPVADRCDDDLLAAMNRQRRALVRRAQNDGVRVRAATEQEVCTVLPALFARPFEQQGLPCPYPADSFAVVWRRLGGHPDVLFQTAECDGEVIAVQIALAGGPRALGWVMGRTDGQRGSDAFASMIWRTAAWARDRGCRDFDLVGAPTEGIARYKQGFGAQEHRYTVLRRQARSHRLAMRVLDQMGHRPATGQDVPASSRSGSRGRAIRAAR
jgi:Acetyltransferase (GNAT) domain